MARKQLPAAEAVVVEINTEALAQAGQAATELVLHDAAVERNVAELATRLSYEGTVTVGALEDGIRFYQQRTVEACMELGKRLLLLKELTPHGEFQARIELLGIHPRTAQQFMSAMLKFSNANTSSLLRAAGGQSKLLELLVLDDGQISALENGDSVNGITLEKIDTMSVRELKAALREVTETAKARQEVLSRANAERDALKEKALRPYKPKKGNPAQDADEAAALDELFSVVLQMDGLLGRLGNVVRDLQSNEREPMRQRGLEAMRHVVACVREIVMDHGLEVDTSADAIGGRPSWLDLDAIDDAADKAQPKDLKSGKA